MIKKIFKYIITPIRGDEGDLDLPFGSEILSVTSQRDKIVLYAIINPDEKKTEKHTYLVQGTGIPITSDLTAYKFINTVSLFDRGEMFHVFIKKKGGDKYE